MKYIFSLYTAFIFILCISCQSGNEDYLKVPFAENLRDSIACGPEGSAHDGANKASRLAWAANPKKNRSDIPDSSKVQRMKIEDLIAPDANKSKFTEGTPVQVTGYVVTVKHGGKETCNCGTTDIKFMDTHIELTPNNRDTSSRYKLIVEVTPRLRQQMKRKGEDWSTESLHERILYHIVTIQGWLFYDEIHEEQAFSTNPANNPNSRGIKPDWRASCWEIHPITGIQIID